MGTKPHLFLSKVDNLITRKETQSLSGIPREDCHGTCSSVERGGGQSQPIPRLGFREDFLLARPLGLEAMVARGLSLLTGGGDGCLCVLYPGGRGVWRGKVDVTEGE